MFSLTLKSIEPEELMPQLNNLRAGACVTFAGWIRNHNQGKEVISLEYEVYQELALKEGSKILQSALDQFSLNGAIACHRYGKLNLGDIAVWVGVTAPHRREAFQGAEYIIDQIKHRLPIWKREFYGDGSALWVDCCATPPLPVE